MTAFPHLLERTVDIGATVDTVFEYFTDSALWAAWWGTGSAIDARPGGRMLIRHNNGVEVTGEVLEVDPPRRIVFTYGYATGAQLPKAGDSQVTIALEPQGTSTRLHLRHAFAEVAPRDPHVQGWRYQLSVFATTIADRLHAGAGDTADAWFAAWSDPEAATREATVGRIAAPASASAIATASSPGSRICTRTSPPCTASCRACASSASAPRGTARASPSSTGSRAERTAPSAGAARTSSRWAATAASSTSSACGRERGFRCAGTAGGGTSTRG